MENQKKQFILLYLTGKFSKTYLCHDFGISRPTGDAIIKRYENEGWDALDERSRRHQNHPFETPDYIQDAIASERRKHPRWGARKIIVLLERDPAIKNSDIPSETTVNNILKKQGFVIPRRKGRRKLENKYPVFDPSEPNEIWSTDFKGKFKMGNKVYCNPLTLADSCSRFLFAIRGLERADTESCKPIYEKVFREWGIPLYIHSDNGAPFGNALSLRRMTRLAVWFMEIGITPVYSDPAHPEQNGRLERMHRDLKAEATRPPGTGFRSQQWKFDNFREEYNTVRPHEALEMKTPSQIHTRSERDFPGQVRDWDYDKEMQVRMVTVNGAIRWGQKFVMISSALSGKYVGLKEIENGVYSIYYRHVLLGIFYEQTMTVLEADDLNF